MIEIEFNSSGNLCCKSLSVVQYIPDGCLKSQNPIQFQFLDDLICFEVSISQNFMREINLVASQNISLAKMWSCFQSVERLLMLFDGRFYPIKQAFFNFQTNDDRNYELYDKYLSECLKRRLSFYDSADFCQYTFMSLLNYAGILDSQLYESWIHLEKELDIIHSVALYCMAEGGTPVDTKCAHFIEVFEPLAELISKYNKFFPSLNAENRAATLRFCLDTVISQYGHIVFQREFTFNKDKYLKLFVDTRNRIMHIKSKQGRIYCSGAQCVLYLAKFSLLYRRVLFSLLGVDDTKFIDQLEHAVGLWDDWAKSLNL